MRFEFDSYWFRPIDLEYWQKLIGGTIEDDKLYIEVDKISELKDILNKIPDNLYEDTNGWYPREFHIDFEWNVITLYDSYCE